MRTPTSPGPTVRTGGCVHSSQPAAPPAAPTDTAWRAPAARCPRLPRGQRVGLVRRRSSRARPMRAARAMDFAGEHGFLLGGVVRVQQPPFGEVVRQWAGWRRVGRGWTGAASWRSPTSITKSGRPSPSRSATSRTEWWWRRRGRPCSCRPGRRSRSPTCTPASTSAKRRLKRPSSACSLLVHALASKSGAGQAEEQGVRPVAARVFARLAARTSNPFSRPPPGGTSRPCGHGSASEPVSHLVRSSSARPAAGPAQGGLCAQTSGGGNAGGGDQCKAGPGRGAVAGCFIVLLFGLPRWR